MSATSQTIWEWQKEFRAGKPIYYTWYVSTNEPTGNYYDSREAAQLEVDYNKSHGGWRVTIHEANVHTMKLSQERWTR